MRDIRSELLERLEGIRKDREAMEAQVKELERQEMALKVLMEAEGKRFTVSEPMLIPTEDDSGPIRAFIERTLPDGKAMKLEDLVAVAQRSGLKIAPGKSIGRSIHAALLGLKARGLVESLGSGVWMKQNAPHVGSGGAL